MEFIRSLLMRHPVPDPEERSLKHDRRADGADLSLAQIARAGVMVFGYLTILMGIVFLGILFHGVYGLVFNDASGLETIFEKWRSIMVPEGVEPGEYDRTFPVTTVLTFAAMAIPVLFLAWLATKVLAIGITMANLKDRKHDR